MADPARQIELPPPAKQDDDDFRERWEAQRKTLTAELRRLRNDDEATQEEIDRAVAAARSLEATRPDGATAPINARIRSRHRRPLTTSQIQSQRGDEHLCAVCERRPGIQGDSEGRLVCKACACGKAGQRADRRKR